MSHGQAKLLGIYPQRNTCCSIKILYTYVQSNSIQNIQYRGKKVKQSKYPLSKQNNLAIKIKHGARMSPENILRERSQTQKAP